MKSERGVTLTSIMIYIIALTIAVSVIGRITTYFYKNINYMSNDTAANAEYTKFNSYLTDEINIEGNSVELCDEKYILFGLTENQYTFHNGGIYRGKTKISKNVEECKFNYNQETKIITVEIKILGKDFNTTYTVSKSTKKNINNIVASDDIYVTLYTDGTLGFSNDEETLEDKIVSKSYGNIKDQNYAFFENPETNALELNTPWFTDTPNITTVNFTNTIIPTDTSCWFAGCAGLTSFENIKNLNTDNVTNMADMFAYCMNIQTLDLSNFNTENVTDMAGMFSYCLNIQTLDLSNFNTENVTNMDGMFSMCSNMQTIDISNFNTEKVTSMIYMFAECELLTSLDLTSFNTINVTQMNEMFIDCTNLETINVSVFWDTDNATTNGMFENCGTTSVTIVE